MSKLFNWAAARVVAAFALALPLAAMADITKVNPVTGATDTYSYTYVGSGDWTTSDWHDANGDAPSTVPQASGSDLWDPLLMDGDVDVTAGYIEGWGFRVGLFGGANLDVTKIRYWNSSAYAVVDKDSKLTINEIDTTVNWNATVNYYVAAAGGVTYKCAFSPTVTANAIYNYSLAGSGSVVYESTVTAGSHVIKQADITLSGTSQVTNKTLVSFTSSSKTFAADATIKRLDSTGADLDDDAHVATVNTTGTTTLTTSDAVGTCELVQTSTGIELYWVDGDPTALTPTVYKPSININFTNGSGNGLTTGADVGLSGYGVPGTSWNNYVVANSTFSTVNAVDSTGAASAMSGVSVTISGTRGSYSCSSLTPSSNPLHGYIDENDGNPAPTITVTGIPYYKYRVLVYHSTDTANAQFNYDTINGANYTYVENVLSDGTTAWGNAGAQDSANAIAEGGNVLVTEALSGSTLTVVGHRSSGSVRGCIAAIQIIEVKADIGENDLEIPVSGDTVYTVEETKELSGTVYLTGSGTLTLGGDYKISAATINVGDLVTLVVDADRLDGITFTGAGTVVYDGSQPDTTKGFDNSAWTGTVWVKNIGSSAGLQNLGGVTSGAASANPVNSWGNENSFVKFTNVYGFMYAASCPWTLILEDEGDNKAWYNNNGWSANDVTIARIMGSGTFYDAGNKKCRQNLVFTDATAFAGSIRVEGKRVGLGGKATVTGDSESLAGVIEVVSGATATLASGKTWYAGYRIAVNGTLTDNGILDGGNTSAAISGTGTVVFGGVPSPTGDAWWKNAAWTGTVQIDNITDMIGRTSGYAGTYLDFNSYGNANSLVKLGNLTGWMDNYTCNVPVNLAGTLTINNGVSGEVFTFKKLISSGGYITATDQSATFSIRIEDGSEYAGYIGLNSKRVIFGTGTAPAFVKGQIYVSSDATITVPSVNTAYWSVGGILVDGELKADNLARFGGGTNITTGDDGVFTLTSTGNGSEGETDTDYARIKGTGSLKYDGTGWRALSTNNFPTAVTLVNEQAGDILLSRAITYNIGSLAGSKNFQGNYGSGSRYLNITQSEDTEWSGNVIADSYSRIAGFTIDAASTGTFTYSGTGALAVPLAINGGTVNITGNWKGNTTVASTIGGTGTLTGNLTFSDGATFKAAATALTVSGTVTLPTAEGETLTIDATGLTADEVTILSSSSITTGTDVSKVTVNGLYTVEPAAGALKLVSIGVEVTVPDIPNTTVTVTVGENTIGTEPGAYKVAPDSVVTVTYAAAPGYEISGTTEYTIDTSKGDTTFNPTETTVAQYVASITVGETTTKYTSLQAAVTAAAAINGGKMLLLSSAYGMVATIPAPAPGGRVQFYIAANDNVGGTVNAPAGDYIMTTTPNETIEIGGDDYSATKYTVAEAAVAVTISEARTLYAAMYIGDAVSAAIAGGLGSKLEFVNGTDSTPYEATLTASGFTVENNIWTFTTLPVAKVTHGVIETSYLTLATAFANVEDGDTITLLTDVALDSTVVVTNSVTLDLNGNDIAATGVRALWIKSGAVSITGEGVVSANGGGLADTSSVIRVGDGATNANAASLTIGANVTIASATCYGVTAFGKNTPGITLVVNGTVSVTGTASAISGNGSSGLASAYITVNEGATVSAMTDAGIYFPGTGTLDITGGTITGPTAVYVKCGTVNISGGTLTGTANKSDYAYKGNGLNATGDALVIDTCGYPGNPASVSVTGGTFTSQNADAVASYKKSDDAKYADDTENEAATGFVSGGTFNTAVEETYCAEGYEPTDDGSGHYTVRVDRGWIYEAADYPGYTGSWSNDVEYVGGKIKIEDGNTYTAAKPSDGQMVTVAMELSFDDANDEEEAVGEAKAAIRLASGETSGTYQFQLYTSDGANMVWTNATATGVEAMTNVDYTIVFVLDLTNKVYTASIVDGVTTNALSIGENVAEIPFAYQGEVTPVQQIDFVGAGKVTSIEGSYEDVPAPVPAEEFQPDDEVTIDGDSVTLTSDQATWLNACSGIKAEKDAALLGLDATAFNNAYLLNLDITDSEYDGTFSFEVTDFTVGDAKVTVEVTLTRKGKLDGGINGTLKLTGTADLAIAFEDISETPVGDDDFSDGDTATWELTKGSAKFFLPVIE